MNPVEIMIAARIKEATAKGIAAGAKLIAQYLGKEDEDDDSSFYIFKQDKLRVVADKYGGYVTVFSTGNAKVFKQDGSGKIELFIPGEWEDEFRVCVNAASVLLRAEAKKDVQAAVKRQEKEDKAVFSQWQI